MAATAIEIVQQKQAVKLVRCNNPAPSVVAACYESLFILQSNRLKGLQLDYGDGFDTEYISTEQ